MDILRRRAAGVLAAVLVIMLTMADARVTALGATVAQVRAVSGHVRAAIDLSGAFPPELRRILEQGGTLHLRIESALWEDRALWDRAVEPPRVTVFRIVRQPNGAALAVIDAGGGAVTYRPYPDPVTIDVDLGGVDALADGSKYYLDAAVTIGTLDDDELSEANEAVFGRDNGPAGLKRVGKFLLNAVLQVSDYVRSVSAKVRSDRFTGAQLKRG
jgi:hypothetical protein